VNRSVRKISLQPDSKADGAEILRREVSVLLGRCAALTGRVETESGGTRRRTGGEVKGKEANGVGSQQSSA